MACLSDAIGLGHPQRPSLSCLVCVDVVVVVARMSSGRMMHVSVAVVEVSAAGVVAEVFAHDDIV